MTSMSFFQRAATLVFSLLLHGFIAIAGFFFASTEILPEEKAYRVSLAEFAPAQTSIAPGQEKKTTSASAEPQPKMPIRPVEPEVAPTPPTPAPAVPATPVTPSRPKPKPQNRTIKQTQDTENRTEQASAQKSQTATMSQNSTETGGGTAQGTARTMGDLSVYAEDVVDQRPSISRRVMPEYPNKARRMNMQGQVVVQLVVDVSGKPQQCTMYSSSPTGVFDEAALAAARRTRFLPGKVRGQPVNTIVLIPYKFSLR